MTIQDIRARLRGVHGDGAAFTACCPAHDDANASLSVSVGSKGILLHCFAGCSTERICEALGIDMRDLFFESSEKGRGKAPPKAEPRKRWLVKEPFAIGQLWKNRRKGGRDEPIVDVYDYRDAEGQVVLRIARTELIIDGHKEKSFPVHSLDAKDGKWYWDKGDRGGLLYCLPELLADKAAERAIFLVEGEKDVDNMRALGFSATCNPGGGGAEKLSGKWTEQHTAWIAGAHTVYLIPDNDDAGNGLMRYIASQIQGKVRHLHLLQLKDAFPELPPKGDVTDFFKALGKQRGLEEFRALMVGAPEYQPSANASNMAGQPPEGAGLPTSYVADSETYLGIGGYCIHNGCLCKPTKDDGYRVLAPFVAVPREVILCDDGLSAEQYFLIDGWGRGGVPLDPIRVSTQDFGGMQWPIRHWGFWGNLEPVHNAEREVRKAISDAGRKHARQRRVFMHTGWRQIAGRWAYLYNGGAVGAQDVSVELDGAMKLYNLSAPEGFRLPEGGGPAVAMLTTFPPSIVYPLMGACYLAPLFSTLEAVKCRPSFVMYLEGSTGSYKSTLAALILSHYGPFSNRDMPANFHGTPNSTRVKAFIAKDALFVVDDYHPESDPRMLARMNGVAQEIMRAVGDGSDRSRLTNRRMLDEEKPPRGLVMMTGEQLPDVGASGLYRLYVINVQPGEIALNDTLTYLQDQAEAGAFRGMMRGYIEWLAEQMDGLEDALRQKYRTLRDEANGKMRGKHGRMIEATAHLLLGCEMMLDYYQDIGLITAKLHAEMMAQARASILANVEKQADAVRQESPTLQFLTTLAELMATKTCQVMDLALPLNQPAIPTNMIGYRDAEYYYFLPGVVYGAVQQALKDQGAGLPLKKGRMLKQLAEEGVIEPGTSGPSRVKRINSINERVLFMRRGMLDGKTERMDQLGFDDVSDRNDLPF